MRTLILIVSLGIATCCFALATPASATAHETRAVAPAAKTVQVAGFWVGRPWGWRVYRGFYGPRYWYGPGYYNSWYYPSWGGWWY